MQTFRLTGISLETPVTSIARDSAQVSEMLVVALKRAFGQLPEVAFSISEWRAPSPEREMLQQLADLGEPGFVQKHERFWDLHDDPTRSGDGCEIVKRFLGAACRKQKS